MYLYKPILPGLAIALVGSVFAQGDDCSTALAISTLGTFAFDTSTHTTSTFDGGGSCTGADNITFDGFYQWTAPSAGDFVFDTETSTFDTQMSLHAGSGCAATCSAHDDDGGNGNLSRIQISGIGVGDVYLIQVGGFGANGLGVGALNINPFVDPCTLPDDALEDNDTCLTAVPLATGVHTGLWASTTDSDFYTFTVQATEVMAVTLTNQAGEIDFEVFDGACNALATIGGSFTYTNTTGAPETVIFEALVNATVGGSTCASYDLDLAVTLDPCQTAPDDSFEENDDCASASPMTDGSYPGLFVSKLDKDHFAFCVADGATVQCDILFMNATADLDFFLRDAAVAECGSGNGANELADGFSTTDDETLTWTNATGANVDVVLEVNVWNNPANGDCNTYELVIAGSGGCDGVGVAFCDPGSINSTGGSAVLSGAFGSGVGSDLHLEVAGGVPTQLGIILVGNEATSGVPVGNGLLCLSGTSTSILYLYNGAVGANSAGFFDAAGVLQNVVGTSLVGSGFDVPGPIPSIVPIIITAGDTWHFQCWFRDTPAAVGASNLSNGLSVTF